MRTRDKIIGAATYLLESEKAITMEEVAREAAVSRATIYRYYSNVDVLAAEAALHMNADSLEKVVEDHYGTDWVKSFLGIQQYYNELAINNEGLFRKYLSVNLDPESGMNKRGARRVKALHLALDNHGVNLPKDQREKLVSLATLYMGIEAFIVMRDVCGLTNAQTMETLHWGLEMMLKGCWAEGKKD